jgi:hypothetical protein
MAPVSKTLYISNSEVDKQSAINISLIMLDALLIIIPYFQS